MESTMRLALLALALLSASAHAKTLFLIDEIISDESKICVYSDHINEQATKVVRRNQFCPSTIRV